MSIEQIKELLKKYRLGLCTPAEVQIILNWVDSVGSIPHPDWTEEEQAAFFELLDNRISALTGVNINAQPGPAPVVPFRKAASRSRLWWRYAAAAVILFAVAAIAIILSSDRQSRHSKLVSESLANDVLPGRDGAILTLADGSRVLLDSMGNGTVAVQGKTTVLIKNRQLIYDAGGAGSEILYNTMTTPKGRQYQLVLPDGSKVWLNAASSITYPASFSATERSVSIHGEAYFEVAKDKSKPFLVNVNDQSQVEVLGTHFNINSYEDEGDIKVTLLEGSVKIDRSVTLRPGQQGIVPANTTAVAMSPDQQQSNTAGIAVINNIDLEAVMAWKDGYFQFNETSLSSVLKQLSRWYDVDVVFEGDIPAQTFIGEIPKDATLSQVLKVLEKTGVLFSIDGKKIIVRK